MSGLAVSSALVLPVGAFGVMVCVGLVGLVGLRASAGWLRRVVAIIAAQRERSVRRDARALKALATKTGFTSLVELTKLADEIELRDPEFARRFDLEGLLERHVALVAAHERALAAAQMADREQLERLIDGYRADPGTNPKRLELCERRLRCRAACEAQAKQLDDELAILADTIRLIAQHVSCPDELGSDDVIDRQLAELDAHGAARRQLAAELADRLSA